MCLLCMFPDKELFHDAEKRLGDDKDDGIPNFAIIPYDVGSVATIPFNNNIKCKWSFVDP